MNQNPIGVPDPGLGIHIAPGGSDRALADLGWRTREAWRLLSGRRGEVCPDGYWTKEVDRVTVKEWCGYHRRVHLETDNSPGGGWRVWMDLPGDEVTYPVEVRHVREVDGTLEPGRFLELRYAPDPSHVPTFRRPDAFAAAELFMSGYAIENAESVAAIEQNGLASDD